MRKGDEAEREKQGSSLIYRPRAVARRSEWIGEALSTSQGWKSLELYQNEWILIQ